jgi:hypothetical protein
MALGVRHVVDDLWLRGKAWVAKVDADRFDGLVAARDAARDLPQKMRKYIRIERLDR